MKHKPGHFQKLLKESLNKNLKDHGVIGPFPPGPNAPLGFMGCFGYNIDAFCTADFPVSYDGVVTTPAENLCSGLCAQDWDGENPEPLNSEISSHAINSIGPNPGQVDGGVCGCCTAFSNPNSTDSLATIQQAMSDFCEDWEPNYLTGSIGPGDTDSTNTENTGSIYTGGTPTGGVENPVGGGTKYPTKNQREKTKQIPTKGLKETKNNLMKKSKLRKIIREVIKEKLNEQPMDFSMMIAQGIVAGCEKMQGQNPEAYCYCLSHCTMGGSMPSMCPSNFADTCCPETGCPEGMIDQDHELWPSCAKCWVDPAANATINTGEDCEFCRPP